MVPGALRGRGWVSLPSASSTQRSLVQGLLREAWTLGRSESPARPAGKEPAPRGEHLALQVTAPNSLSRTAPSVCPSAKEQNDTCADSPRNTTQQPGRVSQTECRTKAARLRAHEAQLHSLERRRSSLSADTEEPKAGPTQTLAPPCAQRCSQRPKRGSNPSAH